MEGRTEGLMVPGCHKEKVVISKSSGNYEWNNRNIMEKAISGLFN